MKLRRKRVIAARIAALGIVSGIGIAGFAGVGTGLVEAFSSGPPAAYTNAPGEDNCTECHTSFPVNSGKGAVAIMGLPHDYLPGQQVQVHVTTSDPQALIFGFQVTAVDQTGTTVGTFSVPNVPVPKTQIVKGTIGSGSRQYVEQTTNGLFDPVVQGSNTWTFTWITPSQRAGKVTFYASGNAANSNQAPSGDYIYTTARPTLSGSAISNFDGDFASDIAVFRPRTGTWYSRKLNDPTVSTFNLGGVGDKSVAGDYDGDGETDFAAYRPSTAEWRIQRSTAGFLVTTFGVGGDIPVPGDYDGDGKTDLAVFHAASGGWTVQKSSGGTMTAALGQVGDKPVQADYDGDAKTDVAVFRPSNGTWYLLRSRDGAATITFGTSADKPVQADYDGDGRSDIAYYHPSSGVWTIMGSSAGLITETLGTGVAIPSPADYDGDGLSDVATFVPGRRGLGGTWQVLRSSDHSTISIPFGMARDIPVANSYLAQ